MPQFESVRGGYILSAEDQVISNTQKWLTKQINEKFVQVGAVFLKPASKFPLDESWFSNLFKDVDLQSWIDDEDKSMLNVGFNMQTGWVDVDIDAEDPEFARAVVAGMEAAGCDCRFAFGRRSMGTPTHIFIQLSEEESANFDDLKRFRPKPMLMDNKRCEVEMRSIQTTKKDTNLEKSAKQTVVPGSIYSPNVEGSDYDLSIWYGRAKSGARIVAGNITDIAATTARTTSFTTIVRGIAFGTIAFLLRNVWVEGQRQLSASKFTGWLARIVFDSTAINEHEVISKDVFCAIDSDAIALKLIDFLCDYFGDEEKSMRRRTYLDASEKLGRNPEAKIPGWISMEQMIGAEYKEALRTVIMPGNDVSKLTEMAERYIYDETDNSYIDKVRHRIYAKFTHGADELDRRHKGETIFIAGKPISAFRLFESSNIRRRVGTRDMYPDLVPGEVYRVDSLNNVVSDEVDTDASVIFNTWKGWPIGPAAEIDKPRINRMLHMTDKLIGLLCRDNKLQSEWVKDWIAWIFQHPGEKQQIAWVVMGDQGVGKSFFGNIYMRSLLTERLWSSVSPKILDQAFTIGPFKEKLFSFVDEADFTRNHSAVEEIKKLIRNTEIAGMEKYEEARTYRIFTRLMFASNKQNIGVSQRDVRDRALFYTRTYDAAFLHTDEMEFRKWAEKLKPYFDEFSKALADRANIEQLIRFYMDRPVDRHSIESIRYSSGDDPEIAAANMSWSRRMAKAILEQGWIASDDLAWEMPFDLNSFNTRVVEESRRINIGQLRPDTVMSEFKSMGMVEFPVDTVNGVRMRMFRMKKWGECIKLFKTITNIDIDTYRELDDKDFGDNTTLIKDRPPRRGSKAKF